MKWTLPGTCIAADTAQAPYIEQQFQGLFIGGGIMMSQITAITALESYDVQNWVKRGFLSPPERKRYSLDQLCRILTINMLKSVFTLEQISDLLTGICTGQDAISDSRLYFLFVHLAANYRTMQNDAGRDARIRQELEASKALLPPDPERVEKVLCIMLTAWASAQLKTVAAEMLEQLETEVER